MGFQEIVSFEYLKENVGHMFSLIDKVNNKNCVKLQTYNQYILYSNKDVNFKKGQIFIADIEDNPVKEKAEKFPYIVININTYLEIFKIIKTNKKIAENMILDLEMLNFDKSLEHHVYLKNINEDTVNGIFTFKFNNGKWLSECNAIFGDSYNYNEVISSKYYLKDKVYEYFCPNDLVKTSYIISEQKFLELIFSRTESDNEKRNELILRLQKEFDGYNLLRKIQYSLKIKEMIEKIKSNKDFFHSILEKYSKEYLEKNNLFKELNKNIKELEGQVNILSSCVDELNIKNEILQRQNDELKNVENDLLVKKNDLDRVQCNLRDTEAIFKNYKNHIDKLNKIFYKIPEFNSEELASDFSSNIFITQRFFYFKEIKLLKKLKENFAQYKDTFFVINADASWLIPDAFWKNKGVLNNVEKPISIKELFDVADTTPQNIFQIFILGANRAPIEGYFYPLIKAVEANHPLIYQDELLKMPDNIIFFLQIDEDKYSAILSDNIKSYMLEVNPNELNKILNQGVN